MQIKTIWNFIFTLVRIATEWSKCAQVQAKQNPSMERGGGHKTWSLSKATSL